MKTIKIFALLLIATISTLAQSKDPVLKFNKNGKFKIAQFTDVHFQYNSYRSDSAMVMIQKVLKEEKPDLVVLTGDIVCSKNTKKAWLSFAKTFIDAKIPWAVVLGNHDIEYEMSGAEIMQTISGLPYCVTEDGPGTVSGNGNYILEVKSSASPTKNKAILYFLDSHSGFKPETNLGSYQWINFDQIDWYKKSSENYTEKNNNTPYPSLAFFHIPLPEYDEIVGKKTTFGTKEETVCSPDINTGLYAAMIEAKDIMGVFVGHDHNNNYIGVLRDISLAYGYVSGRQCYGKIGRGTRIIELYEGERKFDTWVKKYYECDRDLDVWFPASDSEKKFFVTYPDSFIKKKK
ncbi:metallophosphoesterase family protein [Abyssalbus ytuae]|uniref:Metallophosphoesterase family protein n=1 Tax=Abyssalbus ytuae TaxID=2926907 RepID=A0A9E6ZMZ7_9FLAO|nr:metallophosphoesterase family protein [Abyssalbus ytuae]UOB17265.1 metallophosphoesterase family protein [Abyssalbus ytuae]